MFRIASVNTLPRYSYSITDRHINSNTKHVPVRSQLGFNSQGGDIVNSSGDVSPTSSITVLDTAQKSLDLFLGNPCMAIHKNIILKTLDGMHANVRTERGTFTLEYPDTSRSMAYINGRWVMLSNFGKYHMYPGNEVCKIESPRDAVPGDVKFPYERHGFGYRCVISGDGDTLVVLHPSASNNEGFSSTEMYVYRRIEGVFSGEVYAVVESYENGVFGNEVAISSNGNRICINGYSSDMKTMGVYVYENTEGSEDAGCGMNYECKYIIEEECSSLSLSSDGRTVAIGHSCGISVYDNSSGDWVLRTEYTESGDALFGSRVCISGDGDVVCSVSDKNTGIVYAGSERYVLDDGKSVEGYSIACDFNGRSVFVGSSLGGGSVSVFRCGGSGDAYKVNKSYAITSSNTKSMVQNSNFGYSVAVSSDGNTLVVGAPLFSENKGCMFVFTCTDECWTLRTKFVGVSEGSVFGYSCSISSNGDCAASSGIGYNGKKGAVWVFN